ncbi:MAG: peptide chain release factor 1 [Parcubacteria group bacterium Greene0714_21]|nr:MAG: peptide chain release factor 1 [Parcubacteria group bacterium Greene0416_39]TSC97953.1 MAG: peptide chain release factor 1 [Parcubacteria group bacterium Greene1014_47]TSD04530.1 MAG: peptide chain release factor 1 [Parcubacteria group bacterium Greene0714_21]
MPDLKALKEEYATVLEELMNPELIANWEKFQEFSKRKNNLEKILKKTEELEELTNQIEENEGILSSQEDKELAVLAQQELVVQREKIKGIEKELQELTKKGAEQFPAALVMEIRAGTGGEEAALFAKDLHEMYVKYAISKGWSSRVLNLNETDIAGLKEVSLEIEGEDAFEKLRFEGGVHRVQRIPVTEKAGRVHTSTASLAILPKPKYEELQISPNDILLEFYNSSGPGGQNVNKRKTAVRVTYLPTKLVVTSQTSRSQEKNKEFAMALLSAKLLEQKEKTEEKEFSKERKAQIGWAKRAEKIRTYNFPQDRLTDHRIEKSWHGLEKILSGNLDPVIGALQEFQNSQK